VNLDGHVREVREAFEQRLLGRRRFGRARHDGYNRREAVLWLVPLDRVADAETWLSTGGWRRVNAAEARP
jgi:hypothetical protein